MYLYGGNLTLVEALALQPEHESESSHKLPRSQIIPIKPLAVGLCLEASLDKGWLSTPI